MYAYFKIYYQLREVCVRYAQARARARENGCVYNNTARYRHGGGADGGSDDDYDDDHY